MNPKTHPFTRRGFLKNAATMTGAALAAPSFIPASALGADGTVAPSNRTTIGMIGVGDHGFNHNLTRFLYYADAQVVAVCDVDRNHRGRAKTMVEGKYAEALKQGTYKGCATYIDFRELLARRDIDAVMIATPDHWHVIPAILAARAGKDVMCEKPLSLTVVEGRVLSNTLKKYDRIFQTASENRSMKVFLRMAELVRNGRIGPLKEIRVELPRGWSIRNASRQLAPPPPELDYKLWLGQAPEAPYCEARVHWNFRWISDYSGGMLTDWGAHIIDIAQWANNTELTGPISVEGQGEWPTDDLYNTATQFDLNYTYANGVKLNVASKQPGIRFAGTEGWVGNTGWGAPVQAEPKKILDEVIGPNETHLYTADNEHRNFLDGVQSRKPCYAPAEIGHRTITIAHLGNIAMKLGRKLKWDPAREQFIGDDSANALLDRPRRDPWQLPGY